MSFSSTFGSLGSLLVLDCSLFFVVAVGGGNEKRIFSFGKSSVESILIPALSTATGVVYMIAVMVMPYML